MKGGQAIHSGSKTCADPIFTLTPFPAGNLNADEGQERNLERRQRLRFRRPPGRGKRIFIHAKAFSNRNRRPEIDEVVTYSIAKDKQGRPCAANATLAGDKRKKKSAQQASTTNIVFATGFPGRHRRICGAWRPAVYCPGRLWGGKPDHLSGLRCRQVSCNATRLANTRELHCCYWAWWAAGRAR